MIPELPTVIKEDEWLNQLWEKMVQPQLEEFDKARLHVESLKPPTDEEIDDLIETTEVQSVVEMREALEEAETAVETLSKQLDTWARETLSVSVGPDERATATQTEKRTRSQLKSNLEAMLIQAKKFELTEAIEFIETLMNHVSPPSVVRPVSSNTNEIREWARAKGLKVNERGRIPAAVIAMWEDRNRPILRDIEPDVQK